MDSQKQVRQVATRVEASAVDVNQVSSALTHFATSLFQAVGKQAGSAENVFISPFSVAAVLSMCHVGARGNSATQLKASLHLTDVADDKIISVMGSLIQSIKGDKSFTLEAANRLYVANNYKLLDTFQATLKEHFGASAKNVDFGDAATRTVINKWAEELTHSKIKDLLPQGSLDALTRLVLVNGVYFKGSWMRKFDSALTKVEPFHLGSLDKKKDVHMMHIEGEFNAGPVEALDARLLELNYVGGKLSMFIVRPNKVDGLKDLESKLAGAFMDQVDRMVGKAKVHVAIPKFKLEGDVRMKEVLMSLGMGDLFHGGKADLSGVSGNKDLCISNVFHKSFIEVNEEGTEAAGLSSAVIVTRSIPTPPQPQEPFVVDRPSLFFIRENYTKLVLFVGRLAKP